jgi:hypothetical protein
MSIKNWVEDARKLASNVAGTVQENLNNVGDASDFLLQSYNIEFYSVPTKVNVIFKAFVTNFTDSFEVRWDSVTAQGRMDPIQAYQGTGRKISIEWDVVANGEVEAINNLQRCERLVQMMYPVFQSGGSDMRLGEGIGAPPYIRAKFGNLIKKSQPASGGTAAQVGLLCTPSGIDYSPDFDVGVFATGGQIYPKKVSLSMELTVQHEHQLGYSNTGAGARQSAFVGFPYNTTTTVNIVRSTAPGAPLPEATNPPKPKRPTEPQAVVDAVRSAKDATMDVQGESGKVENPVPETPPSSPAEIKEKVQMNNTLKPSPNGNSMMN